MAEETKTLMTAEEFACLPADEVRRELVRGEVIEMTPAGAEHSAVALRIATFLMNACAESDAGMVVGADCGFIVEEDPPTVRAPDTAFVRRDRLPPDGPPQGFFPGAPDLAVEVVSPSDSASDLQSKITEYFEAGTSLVWVAYPGTRQVLVYRSATEVAIVSEEGTLEGDPVLPGLSIPVAEIFAR